MRHLTAAAALIVAAWTGSGAAAQPHGALYTASNNSAANELIMFKRLPNGTLVPGLTVPTGGQGTGMGLGNQGGLITKGRNVYVVNAGSGSISVFTATQLGPVLTQEIDAGGDRPISLTQSHRLLYVLNADGLAGGTDHINGFVIGRWGTLAPLSNSSRPLSGASTDPAQIGFTPDGRGLVVTEKMTNLIDVYRVGHNGRPAAANTHASEGETPFGFGFTSRGDLIVSEAFGGMPNASAVSSYDVSRTGMLSTISASVPTGQTAACWIALTANSRFVYTTNTGSGSVSGYHVSHEGVLTPLTPGAATAMTGMGPIDAVVVGNKYLYVLAQGSGQINSFRIGQNGSLTPLQTVSGLPASANGLAAD